ncbi:MAG: hypothetical protein JRF35_13515 [Deltaproteobacteria bacterium]|nr:hypothetical protein [Deltaproteobacteria bacterium]
MQSASGGKKNICLETLDKVHGARLLNYFKSTGIKVGLLVNFKHPKAEIKSLPAIALAQARRAGMVTNLFEGHYTQ